MVGMKEKHRDKKPGDTGPGQGARAPQHQPVAPVPADGQTAGQQRAPATGGVSLIRRARLKSGQ